MYKLGYTSGLAEAKCDEGKETIKVVGDIVDKLAPLFCQAVIIDRKVHMSIFAGNQTERLFILSVNNITL